MGENAECISECFEKAADCECDEEPGAGSEQIVGVMQGEEEEESGECGSGREGGSVVVKDVGWDLGIGCGGIGGHLGGIVGCRRKGC